MLQQRNFKPTSYSTQLKLQNTTKVVLLQIDSIYFQEF